MPVPTFTDTKGRAWGVEVNVATIKRARKLVQVDLLEVFEGKLLDRLATDPILLADVLYVVCKEQADASSVTDEDFGRALAGDAIDGATKALLESLALFHRSPKVRENFGRIADATEQALTRVQEQVATLLETELPGIVDAAVAQAMSGDLSTSAPASSA